MMEQLRQSEQRRLLAGVRDCYAIRNFETFEQFLGQLIASLSRLIPSTIITYNEMNPAKPESYDIGNTAEISTPKMEGLWKRHMHEHPVLAHIVQTDDDQTMKISNFWSQRQLHDKGLYTDFYHCFSIEDALCIRLSSMLPRVVGIAWHRDRSFTERECLTADLIRPHVDQAWQNARIVSQMHSQLQLLESCLEGASAAMILCDAQGRVQFITALARKYLVEYLGATRELDRQLPQQLLAWMRHQNEQLQKNDLPPVRLPLAVQKPGCRLTVRLLSNAEASLFFMEETASVTDTVALMASRLSRRESEVLGWVAQGKTNHEVAATLRMSLPTVKKHMEHILQKLGVKTRTAAAALALWSLSRAD